MTTVAVPPSFLATRRGKLTLTLLCSVAFLDLVDNSIVNVALPSMRHDLHFSVQSLQWVVSAYLLTYGGFMLLGGRAADLLGRRRVLVAGTALFALSSFAGGLATTGRERILDILPNALHQRVPLILGSTSDVETFRRFVADDAQYMAKKA